MDKNNMGLIDYQSFLDNIQMTSVTSKAKKGMGDNFDWENGIIEQI
jgi:hypothetical protein